MPKTPEDPRFQVISRERIADRVAEKLLRLIATGDLAPGERLPGERQLAEMMNVSRVSIRTALQHLKSRGFVSAVQGGGTRVLAAESGDSTSALAQLVKVDHQNLSDLAEIRAGLEVWAARRAAERGSDARIDEIAKVFETMSQPGRSASFKAQDDLRLHLAIGMASGSAVYMHLMSMLSDILEEMFAYHHYTPQIGPSYDQIIMNQRRAICEAIQARDGDTAAQLMAVHLQSVLSIYQSTHDPETAPKASCAKTDPTTGRSGALNSVLTS